MTAASHLHWLEGCRGGGVVPPHTVEKKKRLKVIKVDVWNCGRTVVGRPSVTLHVSQIILTSQSIP